MREKRQSSESIINEYETWKDETFLEGVYYTQFRWNKSWRTNEKTAIDGYQKAGFIKELQVQLGQPRSINRSKTFEQK